MMMAREFRYKCSQTQPMFAVLNIITGWDMVKAIFGLKEIEKVRVAQQNEGWTKVTTAKDWEKAKGQVDEQPSPKKNGGFPYRLVMEIEGREDGQ